MTNKLEITSPGGELRATLSLPSDFRITEVPILGTNKATVPTAAPPSLGPLAAFTGTFAGTGFNTIFRPDNATTPTPLPIPPPPPPAGIDNILELNLTSETLSFSPSLGAVPNRGTTPQGDVFLNGVPYLQSIKDVTNPGQPTGIHLEPGLWMIVPVTSTPSEQVSLVRMASIPHGTTIDAQGTSTTSNGPPTIPAVDITPFLTAPPNTKITFPSQTANNKETFRIPQDLTSFIAANTITQPILNDPNTVLRNHISGQKITSTVTININTTPNAPLFGGGSDNIAFLLGDPAVTKPNAQTVSMRATFWIETVEHTIVVPIFKLGQPPLELKPQVAKATGGPVPTFLAQPTVEITSPRTIVFSTTQIQYSQEVFLNFHGLTWPHVSVATLVPASPIPLPSSIW
jgi:hypothetical protein